MPAARSTSPSTRRVLVAGGSGLIGSALLAQLAADPAQPELHALLRRKLPALPARVQQHAVDFAALPARLPAADDAYCCLGTTIKVAGSEAAFRAVDFDAVLAFARAAHAAGVRRFAVVSALGASKTSGVFYNRVKGEMEAALAGIGFDSLVIARPSLLAGDRGRLGQPVRAGERIGLWLTAPFGALIPKSVRPIKADTVAGGMIKALAQARPGVRIVESGELQTL